MASPPSSEHTRAAYDQRPLSETQRRVWFLEQLEPGCAAHHVSIAVQIVGSLDLDTLRQSLQQVAGRQPILRAAFVSTDGCPRQQIAPELTPELTVADWRDLPAPKQIHQLPRWARAEVQQPFELARGPLWRVALCRHGPTEHTLLLTLHRLIADAPSARLLVEQVAATYRALMYDQPWSPPAPGQYADDSTELAKVLAQREQTWLASAEGQAQRAYWLAQLAGALPALDLPSDRPRPAMQTFHGARHAFTLPPTLADGLRALARQRGTDLETALLAAFQTLLARYSGQTDVRVGLPTRRRDARTQDLIGPLDHPLVVRCDLRGDSSFRDLLTRVSETLRQARAHQDLPFAQLVQALQPARNLSHAPLFQVWFEWRPETAPAPALAALGWRYRELDGGVAAHDLSLELEQRDDGIAGRMTYNTDLFDAATIERLVGHYQTLLAGIVAAPDRSIARLPLLTEAERRQLLVEWNATESDYPRQATLHGLFAAQAARTPDAVALIFEQQHLTYRELDRRANRLARHLQALGVGPEVCVALLVERSLEMIVATLAILKAGGAYVPLNPTYPQEQLAFMLADTDAPIVLTQTHLQHRLPQQIPNIRSHATICLDTDWDTSVRERDYDPLLNISADQLAYVMYTSGSTGRPKGVGVPHRGVVRLVQKTNYANLGRDQIFLQFAPSSFDAATLEVWGPLLNGGRLVVFPAGAASLNQLAQVVQDHQITTLWLTAGLFHQMVELHLESLRGLRQLLAGGDVLSPSHVQRVLQALPNCTLVNGYGPTENTTFTCCHPLPHSDPVGTSVPIGQPIANTQVYLLDPHLNPVPIGVPGELYVGGDGLARGYHNRPAHTAESFVPNPFAPPRAARVPPGGGKARRTGGERLYKTGDLARYRPDGAIEFLGRNDFQVKVRGFRIELGEIEATLAQHSAIQSMAVLAREDTPGDKQIVAYVVPTDEGPTTTSAWRAFLRDRLPDYMIPSAFVTLDALPLTPNGKIDRRALPVPEKARPDLEAGPIAPRDPVEETIAIVWGEVLGLPGLGVYDDFFELGGHSLLATQIISRLSQTFGADLPLSLFFEQPTIAGLAQEITRREWATDQTVPLQPVAHGNAIPLSFAQQRLWFMEQLVPDSPLYNVALVFQIDGELDVAVLRRCLDEIVRRHAALRTTFPAIDGQPVQSIAPPQPLKVATEDTRALPQAERLLWVEKVFREHAQQPFDLTRGPLLRASLVQLADQVYQLLLVVHHIAYDGWSTGVLLKELGTLYGAFLQGQPLPLPELPLQYADFALWQRQHLQGAVLEKHLAYWKAQFDDTPPVLAPPTDRPRPAQQTYRGARLDRPLPDALVAALQALSQRENASLFMTMLAAFQTLLHRYTGQTDVVVGTPIANRNRPEIEELIGFFVNTLPLRTDLSGDPPFRELVGRARQAALGAYVHQDLPLDRLITALDPDRDLSHNPLFQVLFVMQNTPGDAIELPDLSLRLAREVHTGTAKFDLTLYVEFPEQGPVTAIEYNTDLFDDATIHRLLGHWQTLLEGVVSNPNRRLSSLPLLTAAEREQLLRLWGQTRQPYPRHATLHRLFETQAARAPDATALVCGVGHLTYQALNHRANQLAHHLRRIGVGPEMPVGLYLERSVEMIVAALAVLKAGGAYVPIDPAYPPQRAAFMLTDAQAQVLLTQTHLRDRLSQSPIPNTQYIPICLDADREKLAGESTTNLPNDVLPDNPAYAIYTSGSTGAPKGVLVSHYNVVRLFAATQDWYQFGQNDVWTLFHSFAFDFSVWELWGALLHGGRLVIVPYLISRSPQVFYDLLCDEQVTVLNQTPSAFRQLLHAESTRPDDAEALALRWVIFGGEALELKSLQPWYTRRGDCVPQLVNMYGITETTVHVTHRPLRQADAETAPGSVIGGPIPDLQVYLLDARQQPVPIGVPGELYVGGAGLARGYLNRPALTAERFVPDPFPPFIPPAGGSCASVLERSGADRGGGKRLYRSGDLARYRPDGDLEYLGRIDHQVKIRGFRIELGEIESALAEHPAVREGVVLARQDGARGPQLVAYLVPASGAAPPTDALRQFLRDRLPDYMIPSAIVLLDALPLTTSGKVDRRALPAPEQARPELAETFVAPRNAREETLSAIWARVLGLERVGVHDDFFNLGGHSLLATQVVAQVHQILQIELPLTALFEAPTVDGLAALVAQRQRAGQPDHAGEIRPIGRSSPETLPADLDQLSEDEIDALLSEMLAREEPNV